MASQRKSARPARTAKSVKRKAARRVKSAAKTRTRPAGAAAKRHTRSVKPARKAPAPKKKKAATVLKKKAAPVHKKKATSVVKKATSVAKKKAVTVLKKKATPVAKKKAVTVLKKKQATPVTKKPAAAAKKSAPVAKKPVPVAKKSAPVTKKGAAKAAPPAANLPPRRMKAVPRPPTPGPTVRPLGVLPAEARARGLERPSHAAAVPPRAPAPPARPVKPLPKATGLQRVTENDLKELKTLLLAERARVTKEMEHLESTVLKVNPRESSGDLSGYSFHMADAGTDAYEREKAFQFASNEGRLLQDLDEALRRLYSGDYGNCESCGNAIAKARLAAMPTARLCRDCKEKEERENHPQQ